MFRKSILKRSLVLAVLIIFPLYFTGCSWFGGEDENTIIHEPIQEKRIGILKSLGGMTVGEGTHLLEMENRTTMRLRSLNINLDSEKYLNKKVEVRGITTTTEDGKELMEVRSIDVAEDTDEEIINGTQKEYKNSDLGFKFTYIDSWNVKEEDTEVTFTAPKPKPESTEDTEVTEYEPDTVKILQIANPDKKTLEMFLQLPSDPNELITLGYTQTKIGEDQLDGLKKQSADLSEIDIYLVRDTFVYHLAFKGTNNPDSIDNRNTFFNMVTSFQFISFSQEEETEDLDSVTEPKEPDVINNMEETATESDTAEVTDSVTPTEEETTISSNDSSYGIIAQYIGQTINSIAPEESESGTWSAYSFEYVDPNYVYVEYTDNNDYRRLLLTYDQAGTQLTTDIVGYFEPGETTSWERVSGENPVENSEKTVISLGDSGTTEETVVKEGYRYFESLPYDFMAQYPSSWYFSGSSGSGDISHHYGFSNEPVEDGNELVSIDIISGSLPGGSPITVGGNQGVKVYSNDEIAIYIEREDGMIYKIHGSTEHESYVVDIATTITQS